MSTIFRKRTLFVFLFVFFFSSVVWADFSIDKLKLSKTDVTGMNVTLVVYFKVCFTTGTKGIKITTYYGDDAGMTNRVELGNRSFSTNTSCIDQGISFSFGNYLLAGSRFVHVKLEQTGGPIKWDKLAITVLGEPNIGYVGVPSISTYKAGLGETITIRFKLKNDGLSRSDIVSEVQVLYSFANPNDVLDPSKSSLFPAKVTVPKMKAATVFPTTGDLSIQFKMPVPPAAGPGYATSRIYLAVRIDPGKKLIETSTGNNWKTFTVNYLRPDLELSLVGIVPTPIPGKPGSTFTITHSVANIGKSLSLKGHVLCGLTWIDKNDPTKTFRTTVQYEFPPVAVGMPHLANFSSFGSVIKTVVPAKAGAGKVLFDCFAGEYSGLEGNTFSNNRVKGSGSLRAWSDYSITNLKTISNPWIVGKKVVFTVTLKYEGNVIPKGVDGDLFFERAGQSVKLATVSLGLVGTHSRLIASVAAPLSILGKGRLVFKLRKSGNLLQDEISSNNSFSIPFSLLSDFDKDGFASDKDCNDNDKAINPQAKEICDGKDNNCNGQIDEGCPCKGGDTRDCYSGSKGCTQVSGKPNTFKCVSPCRVGVQTCSMGLWGACAFEVKPKAETCNGIDDDCNGTIDDGIQPTKCWTGNGSNRGKGECKDGTKSCKNGKFGACENELKPSNEVCDDKDNDCDGQIDEDFKKKGDPCKDGVGECEKKGKLICSQDQSKVECSVKKGPSSPEVCDGKDNDCDGQIDNKIAATVCYTGPPGTRKTGQCKDGKEKCVKGKLKCDGEIKPTVEVCNRKDDDCDGQIDDNIGPEDCYTGPAATKNVGLCSNGTKICKNGKFGACKGQVLPKAETCNGADENCNGRVDEGVTSACYTGPKGTSGIGECKLGVELCVGGRFSGACSGETKPSPEICDKKDNDCDGQTDEDNVCKKEPSTEPIATDEEPLTEPAKEPSTEPIATDNEPIEESNTDGGEALLQDSITENTPEMPLGVGCNVSGNSDFLASFLALFVLLLWGRRKMIGQA